MATEQASSSSSKPERPDTLKPNPGQPSERGKGTFGNRAEDEDTGR